MLTAKSYSNYYTSEAFAAQGFHIGSVPTKHYIGVMDAQVRSIDLLDSVPARALVQGQEEEAL